MRASGGGKMEERRDQPQWLAGPIGESRGRVPREGAGTAEKTGRACSKEKG